ncbi:MAG: hypothetical protein ACR5LD_00445 [Symbiopectobacterium sp.]
MKKMYVQADTPFRMLSSDIECWYVRGSNKQMVSFSSFSQKTTGRTVHRVWNAIRGSRQCRFKVKQPRVSVPVKRWP